MMKYMVKIDPQKMRNVLRDKGLSQVEVSGAIGKSKNYIAACIRNGEISATALQLIGIKYGITEKRRSAGAQKGAEAGSTFHRFFSQPFGEA